MIKTAEYLVIKPLNYIKQDDLELIRQRILKQVPSGVVVIPNCFEVYKVNGILIAEEDREVQE